MVIIVDTLSVILAMIENVGFLDTSVVNVHFRIVRVDSIES